VDDLLAALGKRIDDKATPSPSPKGGLVLQPNDERRRSGSHYTPRSFTEPIVRKTLEPVLARLVGSDLATVPADKSPTPAQILDLKVADIAVGSAAFLVEACRQLGDALVKAWRVHGGRPPCRPTKPRSCSPCAGRPALPLRRGSQSHGRRSGQALPLARHSRQGSPLHLPRP
jgi:hypothetical protein